MQILGDTHGNLLHVLERECSIQRRHQKVVEEAGSPLFLDGKNPALLRGMTEAALAAARAFGYANAGTVEFLVSDGEFFFIEMNARLQVEHPVTELTTGVDLIGWQLRIAAGERLTLKQEEIRRLGHALEFRIYAEDPVRFLPSPGPLNVFRPPEGEGVRLDAGYAEGGVVTPYYDPMMAKLIVSGKTRDEAIRRSDDALQRFDIQGHEEQRPAAPPHRARPRLPGGRARHPFPGAPRQALTEEPPTMDVPAHITGTVWKIEVSVGQKVAAGDVLVILESMKMEMPVEAPEAGTVKEIRCKPSQAVNEGDVLVVLTP